MAVYPMMKQDGQRIQVYEHDRSASRVARTRMVEESSPHSNSEVTIVVITKIY